MPKQKALKGAADSPSVTDETSNASVSGSNGTNTSPSHTPGAKAVTPRVVLKQNKSPKPGPKPGLKPGPKPGSKVKMTPRKDITESSPPKAKGMFGGRLFCLFCVILLLFRLNFGPFSSYRCAR